MLPSTYRTFPLSISVKLMNQLLEQHLDALGKIEHDEEIAILEHKGFPDKDNIQKLVVTVRRRGGVNITQYEP